MRKARFATAAVAGFLELFWDLMPEFLATRPDFLLVSDSGLGGDTCSSAFISLGDKMLLEDER